MEPNQTLGNSDEQQPEEKLQPHDATCLKSDESSEGSEAFSLSSDEPESETVKEEGKKPSSKPVETTKQPAAAVHRNDSACIFSMSISITDSGTAQSGVAKQVDSKGAEYSVHMDKSAEQAAIVKCADEASVPEVQPCPSTTPSVPLVAEENAIKLIPCAGRISTAQAEAPTELTSAPAEPEKINTDDTVQVQPEQAASSLKHSDKATTDQPQAITNLSASNAQTRVVHDDNTPRSAAKLKSTAEPKLITNDGKVVSPKSTPPAKKTPRSQTNHEQVPNAKRPPVKAEKKVEKNKCTTPVNVHNPIGEEKGSKIIRRPPMLTDEERECTIALDPNPAKPQKKHRNQHRKTTEHKAAGAGHSSAGNKTTNATAAEPTTQQPERQPAETDAKSKVKSHINEENKEAE